MIIYTNLQVVVIDDSSMMSQKLIIFFEKKTCNFLTRLIVQFDLAIGAAFLVHRVEQDKWRRVAAAALGLVRAAAATWALGVVVLGVPHGAALNF